MSYQTLILRPFQRLKSHKCSIPDTDGLTFDAFLENKRKQDRWPNTAGADRVPLNNDDMKRQLSPQSHKGQREPGGFGKPQGVGEEGQKQPVQD